MPFRRPGRATWYVQFATPRGIVRRSTGTTDRAAAEAIEAALRALRARGAHDLLEAAADGRVALEELSAQHDDVERLRARASELDLEPLVEAWHRELRARVSADTARRYRGAVESLVAPGVPFPRDTFTEKTLDAWMAWRHERPGTRRRAHAAMSSFAAFLAERGTIASNPMRRIPAPGATPPRCRWIDAAAMTRLAEAQPAPFRALSALMGGTGLGLATVLCLRGLDVDLERREVEASGRAGRRIARVADWAWRHVARHARALPIGAELFAGVERSAAERAHREACDREGITDYDLSDQRHSWAVRAVRAGMPAELVARQLGLSGPARVLALYGRFMPARAELERWEQLATAQDAERHATEKVALGYALYHPVYHPRPAELADVHNASRDNDLDDRWSNPKRLVAETAGPGDTSPRSLRR